VPTRARLLWLEVALRPLMVRARDAAGRGSENDHLTVKAPAAKKKRAGKWCWLLALLLLGPIGLTSTVVGGHDLVWGLTWSSRLTGVLALTVGATALSPLISREWRLPPRRSFIASLTVGAAGIAALVALGAAERLGSWRLGIPACLLLAAIVVPLLVRLQRRQPVATLAVDALRAPLGKLLAANAVVLALVQIGVSLRTPARASPPRMVVQTEARSKPKAVGLTVNATNPTTGDVPLVADVINVVAARCPPGATSPERLVEQERDERVATVDAVGAGYLLESLEGSGCHGMTLLDTSAIAGEGGILPGLWKGRFGDEYSIPSGKNTICVASAQSILDEDPRRLQVVSAAAAVHSGLEYRYYIEPEGWIDRIASGRREVVVTWTSMSGAYTAPTETVDYLIDGEPFVGNRLLRPGALVTFAAACGRPK
jgi:hypothetical protein